MTRRTLARSPARLVRIAALATAGTIGLAGCVSGETGSSGRPSNSPSAPAASSSPSSSTVIQSQWSSIGPSIRVDLLSLEKIAPNATVLRIRIVNTGSAATNLNDAFSPAHTVTADFGGVALVDGVHMKAYYPWQHSDNNGPIESGFPEASMMAAGASFEASILYPALPSDVTKVNVFSPRVVFTDIPVNASGTTQENDPGYEKSELVDPNILPLTSMQDDLSGDKSEDDSGDKVAIRLSADVLFKLNKASLTDKANALLRQVASRIDQSKTATISVDGYTDSSGNDAINDPLSKRRAQSVRDALQKLVTRQGVSYKVAGHGSSDPVASNKSAEGRQKNRRVTISFSK